MIRIILLYMLAINISTFFVYGLDKRKAKTGERRISEGNLLFFALIGGSIGAWYGMKYFRHKTMKYKFVLGIPGIMILQILSIIFFKLCI